MDYIQAERFARKAYCPEESCKGSRVVTKMAPERQYTVVCPRNSDHPLAMAKSQFAAYLERWRKGERLFSLEDLIFTNTLRVMQRKDPERWDYEVGSDGAVIRIGREWWPGLKKEEMEKMTQALVTVETIDQRIELAKPRFIDARPTPEAIQQLREYSLLYDLDPLLGEITIYESKPMITIDGWYRKVTGSGVYNGESDARILSQEEKELRGIKSPTAIAVAIRQYRKGVDHAPEFIGVADPDKPYRNNPVEKSFAFDMACKRSRVKGFRVTYRDKLPRIQLATFEDLDEDTQVNTATGEIIEGTAREVPPDEQTSSFPPTNEGDKQEVPPLSSQTADFSAAMDSATTIPELDSTAAMIAGAELSTQDRASLRTVYSRNKKRIEQSQPAMM